MITVNNKARDYILTEGGCIHILHGNEAAMCCGRITFGPTVELGQPINTTNYNMLVINGIDVYLPKNFRTPNPLSVCLQNFFGLKTLCITGWKLI